jgi:ribosomal protein S12 methylthiotransferase accessory factor
MRNFERKLTSLESLQKFDESQYQLSLKVSQFDKKYPIYKCYLTDNVNHQIFIGGGGGFNEQGKACAIFEALQHYFSYHSLQINKDNIYHFPLSDVPEKDYLFAHEAIPKFLTKTPKRLLPWLKYDSFTDNQVLYYPLPLTAIRLTQLKEFSYCHDCSWFSHDTGGAVGNNFYESSIHGINEWIECDAYSLLLLKLFIKNPSEKIHLLDKLTLPTHILTLIKHIEQTYHDDLLIVDMTSDIGVPAFFVSFCKQNKILQPKGMGASLSRSYALERAIFEALQSHCLYNENTNQFEKNIVEFLQPTPIMQNAAKCDLLPLLNLGHYKFIDFTTLPDYSFLTDLREQLSKLHGLLELRNLKAFYHHYHHIPNHLDVLNIIIPGLEQFFLVRSGKFIMPRSRGMRILLN